MTKQELLSQLSEKHEDVSKKTVAELVGDVFSLMVSSLKKGEKVSWPGFGSFRIKERTARKGRNPKTGEELEIPASKSIKFKISSGLKKEL